MLSRLFLLVAISLVAGSFAEETFRVQVMDDKQKVSIFSSSHSLLHCHSSTSRQNKAEQNLSS